MKRFANARGAVVAMAVVGLSAATAAACSSPTRAPSPTAAPVSVFTEGLAKARAATPAASDAQIKALAKAAKSGEMSYEEVSALLEDTFTCFDNAGVDYRRLPDSQQIPGFKVPQYSYAEPVAVGVGCLNRFSQYAEGAYQTQPKAAELRAAAFAAERPEVLACLRKKGAVLEDNATYDEMALARDSLLRKAIKDGTEWVDCSIYWW